MAVPSDRYNARSDWPRARSEQGIMLPMGNKDFGPLL